MSSRNVSVSLAKQHQPLLLHNATIYYPGLVLASGAAAGLQFADRIQPQGGGRVLYNLRGPCDDRNLVAVVPSGSCFSLSSLSLSAVCVYGVCVCVCTVRVCVCVCHTQNKHTHTHTHTHTQTRTHTVNTHTRTHAHAAHTHTHTHATHPQHTRANLEEIIND